MRIKRNIKGHIGAEIACMAIGVSCRTQIEERGAAEQGLIFMRAVRYARPCQPADGEGGRQRQRGPTVLSYQGEGRADLRAPSTSPPSRTTRNGSAK